MLQERKLITIRRLSAMYEQDLAFSIEDKTGVEIAAFGVYRTVDRGTIASFEWILKCEQFSERQREHVLKPLTLAIIETGATVASLKLEG